MERVGGRQEKMEGHLYIYYNQNYAHDWSGYNYII